MTEQFYCVEAVWQGSGGAWTEPLGNFRAPDQTSVDALLERSQWSAWLETLRVRQGESAAQTCVFRATRIAADEYDAG